MRQLIVFILLSLSTACGPAAAPPVITMPATATLKPVGSDWEFNADFNWTNQLPAYDRLLFRTRFAGDVAVQDRDSDPQTWKLAVPRIARSIGSRSTIGTGAKTIQLTIEMAAYGGGELASISSETASYTFTIR
jgi:hypothetical protein